MIRKLRIQFIALSTISLLALLILLVVGMNLLNYRSVVREADEVLSLLSQNNGSFPEFGGFRWNRLPPNMSPELPYESRYFSVLLTETGKVIRTETNQIISVNAEQAAEYANQAVQKSDAAGFIGDFRYIRKSEGVMVRITFLDCGRRLDAFYNFLTISILMASAGFVLVVFIISFFSGKFIRPIAESHEKQKRFITDAGHEIKTPLTVISANVDLLEMELEKNECLEDIRQQTKRLASLTDDLVYLARMEEAGSALQMIDFPVSEVVQETATPFKTPAQAQGKLFTCQVQPMLSMRGNDKAIQQLISILMDNALKYSPSGGTVSLQFVRQNRSLLLTVRNTTETTPSPEQLRHVFDRFYRTDPSRNSATGGHGIGLSVAQAIVTAHGGKIHAAAPDAHAFQITAVFPV